MVPTFSSTEFNIVDQLSFKSVEQRKLKASLLRHEDNIARAVPSPWA
jgi:hypothetical protein